MFSYNRYLIEATFQQAMEDGNTILIESICNQVNQYGGYTGMKLSDFRDYVLSIAESMGFPLENIILGGDHLGPFPFRNEPQKKAMNKAREMVKQYVMSGYTKISLDPSMPFANETAFNKEVISKRWADLCAVAEESYKKLKEKEVEATPPMYIIGTEVPIPEGSDEVEERLEITSTFVFKKQLP